MAKLIGHLPRQPTRIPQESSFTLLMIINSLPTIKTTLRGHRSPQNIARKENTLPKILRFITPNKSFLARDMSLRRKPQSLMPITDTVASRTLASPKPVLPLPGVGITHSTIRITIIRISPRGSWREAHRRRWMTTGSCSPNSSIRGVRRRTYISASTHQLLTQLQTIEQTQNSS
jgi:hypothetical protein